MKLLVLGAGAVGCFVGALLARTADVVLVGREELLGAEGPARFRVQLRSGEVLTASCRVAHSVDRLPPGWNPCGILLTMKASSVAGSLARLDNLDSSNRPWLVTMQNGIGSEELAVQAWGQDRVLAGTLTASVSMAEGRIVRQNSSGGIGLAPVGQDLGADCRMLAKALAGHGLICRCLTDYRAMKWSKLVLNQVANGICALTDRPPAAVIGNGDLFALEMECMRETLAVMEALRVRPVDLPAYPVRLVAKLVRLLPNSVLQRTLGGKIARSRGDKLPSLLVDARAGRSATEGDVMYGAVARAAERLDLTAPVSATIARLLNRGATGLTPRQLVTEVAASR